MAGADWREELDGWLAPFSAALGHARRRSSAPLYLSGLLGPGERKSLQPMAARLGLKGHGQLQHSVASPAWDDAPLRRLLVEKADALVGGRGAVLVVDDTALPKQGRHSVGVARQYCGRLGKRANSDVCKGRIDCVPDGGARPYQTAEAGGSLGSARALTG
jgi:SRSO17 transposase